MDAIRRALHRAARSPFSGDIEWAPMPSRFTRPPFNSYDGKTDLVENVSHYIQIMSLHSNNDALMCKVFPSSLKPTTLRWFNWLRKGSIGRAIVYEDGSWETLCNYTSRYWELYNKIGGANEKIAASTFRLGLHEDSKLRDLLTRRPPEDMR